MNSRKRGALHIDREILYRTPLEVMGKALSGLVVWHTEARFDLDRITYYGEHPDFDAIPEGEVAPEYDMTLDANGTSKFNRT